MQNTTAFPSAAETVDGWLEAIGMAKYQRVFVGTSVSQLPSLTDAQLKDMGISLVGHRKRLLQAAMDLAPGNSAPRQGNTSRGEQPAPPSEEPSAEADAEQRKFNSTSSLYINSTITKPNTDEIIFCLAIVIHDRVHDDEESIANDKEGAASAAALFPMNDEPLFDHLDRTNEVPSDDLIFKTIKMIFSTAAFSAECLIVALLYIERLRSSQKVPLLRSNWQPILLSAIVVAQKVWDDLALLNADFSLICSRYTVREINVFERRLLELLEYNLSVPASLYAAYYFELRTLCENTGNEFCLKPLSEEAQRKLERASDAKTEEHRRDVRARGWNSSPDVVTTPLLRAKKG